MVLKEEKIYAPIKIYIHSRFGLNGSKEFIDPTSIDIRNASKFIISFSEKFNFWGVMRFTERGYNCCNLIGLKG